MYTKRAENFPRLPLTPRQLEIPAHWQLSKSGQENLSTLSEHSVLSMEETLKIVPEWYQRLFTIHVFYGGGKPSFATLRLPLSLQFRDRFRGSTSKAATFISAKQFCEK
ncbi:conserved hypothetical protein [Trichinella spiralis]|uniref:hypothetical protein n=1 Tax=Trichinella spiralis TaxID=6334 RepID=UPI0001EFEB27|nr:conserved hypothetical protein [Trichinella spiralis]